MPEIIEVSKYEPWADVRIGDMLEEGVFVLRVSYSWGQLDVIEAGPVETVCARVWEDYVECRPIVLWKPDEVEDWLPRLPDMFNVVRGLRPPIRRCGKLPRCTRQDLGEER